MFSISFRNKVFAEIGDSCSTAISNPLQEGYGVSQNTYKKWYSFYATNTIATLNLTSELNALPDSVLIYRGNCDSLIPYSAYILDSDYVKLISVPSNEPYYVCFISTSRNCLNCLISPLAYYFSMVDGDTKTPQTSSCINPIPNCEYICNGSFEYKSACPPESGNLPLANSWIDVKQTPEYFNSCQGLCTDPLATVVYPNSTKPQCVNIPLNFAGTQTASPNQNGVTGYAGIIAAGSGDGLNGTSTTISYAEYIGQQINQPLQVGVAYNFSMDISWAEVSRYKAKNFGVYFSSGNASISNFITNEPQILFSNFITNANGWVTLTSTFIPTVPGLNKFYFGLFPNATGAGGTASSVVLATPPNQTNLPTGLEHSRWAYYYVDNFSLKLAETEEHFEVSVCPTWTTLGIYEPGAANLVIPNLYTNIDWDATTGLTINPVAIGQETFTATYIGAVPTTITAHAYIGNCPIDLFFHIDFEDLCSCDAFDCPPGPPTAQNNSSITLACFYPTNTNVFQYITGTVTQGYPVVEFNNSFLKMGPYASILVPNGKTLIFNNTTLFACKTMWTGIVVEAGGTLIINNSRIEDALKAIEVQPGANVIIDGCYFNKNYVGVLIESGAGSSEFTGEQMNFSCNNVGSPTNGNLLLIPHIGEHGFAGIKALESPYLKVGNVASTGNTFTETLYGIYAENSFLEAENNDFTNLFFNANDPNSSAGIYAIECDLNIGNSNTSIVYNHFSKLRFGISASYSNVNPLTNKILLIRNNEFENYSSPNTPFERCIFISGGLFPNFEISNNQLESFKTGIFIFGANAIGDIKYNILNGRSFASLSLYQSTSAINISNPLFFSNISIFENRINPNLDHSCNTGINLLSAASSGLFKANVMQNSIYKCRTGINCVGFKNNLLTIKDHDPSLSGGIYLEQKGFIQKGIQLSSCVGAKVTNNYVRAIAGSAIPNANIENRVFGIYVNGACSNTNIIENYFWRLGTGMYFSGGYTNLPLTVNCNRMIQNVNGVNITNTSLGDQGDNGILTGIIAAQDNQWSIPSGTAYMGAKVNIPFGQSYPTWFSRSASLPFLPNQTFKMAPLNCIVANLSQFLVPNSDYNCSFGCPNPPCQHFRIYEMANNESPYDLMSEEELGNVKLALLYQLKNDSLLLDSLLNVGGIITSYISNLLLSEENDLANSAMLLSERDTIGGLAALGGVNTNTDPRANQVIVNEIFARTWARGAEVTLLQDSIDLMQIACTEPQYGGLAVFDAMAMINWDTCGYYNYNNSRNNSNNETTETFKNSKLTIEHVIKLFPNPSSGNISLKLFENFKFDKLQITNLTGILIDCEYKLLNNLILIETLNFPEGFYIIQVIDNLKNVYSLSFIKQ